jgi:hypothetical protein
MNIIRKTRQLLPIMALAAAVIGPRAIAPIAFAAGGDITSITYQCVNNNTQVQGTFTITGPYTGDVVLMLTYKGGPGPYTPGGFSDTGNHATVSVDVASGQTLSYSYTLTYSSPPTNTHRVEVVSPSDTTKTLVSFDCGSPTAAAYAHLGIRTSQGQHIITWTAAQRVLGFNVYAGSTKLNRMPVTSKTNHFTFTTTHNVTNVHVQAISTK